MTTLLQRNKCNFWHLQKLFMWVWVQSWKKQEGCGDSTCGINCNHKRWIILSPLYSNHFTKSRPDNKNSNFPWHQTSAFLELYPVTNTSPCCGCAAWRRLIHHPAIFWKLEAIIVNCTIRVLQCWQKCMFGKAFSKFTISIILWHSKEIVLVGPFLIILCKSKI